MVKIVRNVGRNCFQQTAPDVVKIQTCLKNIKGARFQPFYQGKLDGICGKKTIAAIECFQLMNNIKPTGKVEQVGPTLSRLTQKTSGSVQNKLKALPVVSKSNPQDRAKINTANQKTINEIKNKSPLPKKEAEALTKIISAAGKEDGIPLTLRKVIIDTERGKFQVTLDIANFALPQNNEKATVMDALALKVSKHVGKFGAWQVGEKAKNLIYASMQPYPFLKGRADPSAEFLKTLGLSKTQLSTQALLRLAGAAEKLYTEGK